jgi:hypothetical protein
MEQRPNSNFLPRCCPFHEWSLFETLEMMTETTMTLLQRGVDRGRSIDRK